MKKKVHAFSRRMFSIYHSKNDNSAEEAYKKWDELLDEVEGELFGESEIEFDQQEKEKLKDILSKTEIRST